MRGAVFPVQGHHCQARLPAPPGTCGVTGGVVPDGRVGGGGGGGGAGAETQLLRHGRRCHRGSWDTPTSLFTDHDLRLSEAWLGNHRPLAGVLAGLSLPA
jgi:hypothetical protein